MTHVVREITLSLTPEEWETLCLCISSVDGLQADLYSRHNESMADLKAKISAINKRLVFAASRKET